jgi:membrane protein DedA with SNARE-associated domain
MTAIAAQTILAATGADAGPQWVSDLMDALGAPGAGLAIALENLFPPIPSEVILPLAGFAASNGRMGLIAVLLWTTAGSVIGALALYGVGALLGRERTLGLARRLPLVKVADVEKTEAWFLRHGSKAVFFGRMIPLFRSLVSVPAGHRRCDRAPRRRLRRDRTQRRRLRRDRAARSGGRMPVTRLSRVREP